jgi:hypothetical protein
MTSQTGRRSLDVWLTVNALLWYLIAAAFFAGARVFASSIDGWLKKSKLVGRTIPLIQCAMASLN